MSWILLQVPLCLHSFRYPLFSCALWPFKWLWWVKTNEGKLKHKSFYFIFQPFESYFKILLFIVFLTSVGFQCFIFCQAGTLLSVEASLMPKISMNLQYIQIITICIESSCGHRNLRNQLVSVFQSGQTGSTVCADEGAATVGSKDKVLRSKSGDLFFGKYNW